jgi:hypothetical protein
MRVLVSTLVGVALERLRVRLRPRANLVLVDTHFAVFDPGIELRQCLTVAILTDTRVDAVVPVMYPADEVVAVDVTVGHQGAAMCTTPVQDGHLVIVANDYKIDIRNQRMHRFAVFDVIPVCNGEFIHSYLNLLTAISMTMNAPANNVMT